MTKPNPCRFCRELPSAGYYAGDFAVECDNCRLSVSRHMVDYPADSFEEQAIAAKNAAIAAWNTQNPKGP